MQSSDIENLIKLLAKLPGLGSRSARRAALHLIQNKENHMQPLIETLQRTADNTKICQDCGNVDTISPCNVCTNHKRDVNLLCVVEEVADLWAMERGNVYNGLYHVLGGTLSAIDGRGPESLNIKRLVERVEEGKVKEIILATNANIEGQTTAHYISEMIKQFDVKISRIACGVPIGGELDYLDEGTIGTALNARQPF